MANNCKEKIIIFSAYIGTTFLLFKFVPKNKIRHALIPFLFKQVITWFFGLLVVEKKLISYPYRPFLREQANQAFVLNIIFILH